MGIEGEDLESDLIVTGFPVTNGFPRLCGAQAEKCLRVLVCLSRPEEHRNLFLLENLCSRVFRHGELDFECESGNGYSQRVI